jgi:hypothetical protein
MYAVGAAKFLKSLDIHSGAFTSNGKRKFDALIDDACREAI